MSHSQEIVYIVDDEAGMRKALARLLRAAGFEPRPFATAGEFLEACQSLETGCLVLDVAMPELDGLELQQQLSRLGARVPIIFLTGHGDIPMSVRAIKAGAVDFLTKPVDESKLLDAVRKALRLAATRAEWAARLASLTPREHEVMKLIVTGMPNKKIAADLGTGEQTIKVHRGRVMRKMGAESLAELVRAVERLEKGAADHV